MKYIRGEIIAHQLAVKLCELNGWPADYNSDHRTIAEIRFRESMERGIAAGKIKPHCPLTFTKLNLDKHLFEDATFSEQEVMDYLASEMADDARQTLTEAIHATIERQQTKTPAPLYGHGFNEETQKITTLTKYLELETWMPIEAAMLVCGLQPPPDCHEIPQGAMGLENVLVMPYEDRFHHAKEVLNLWNHRENAPDKIRPAAFVAWCKTQGIDTGWLTNAPEWEAYVTPAIQPQKHDKQTIKPPTAKEKTRATISAFLEEITIRASRGGIDFDPMNAPDKTGFFNAIQNWARTNNHATLSGISAIESYGRDLICFAGGRPSSAKQDFYAALFPKNQGKT